MQEHLPPSAHASGRSEFSEAHRQMVAAQRPEVLALGTREDLIEDHPVCEYVQRMRRAGEWGSGLEALCAAYRYRRPVRVWSAGGYSELCPPYSLLDTGAPPVLLLHNGRDHWDSASGSPPATSGSEGSQARPTAATAVADEDEEDVDRQVALLLARIPQERPGGRRGGRGRAPRSRRAGGRAEG
ncbi:unnamed protein product [Prorocentrum cordatum]|uniref:Ubiquitinyl hydrolase 1 n=1 Tax=Prorocentrum cordatum TaxID=2364126 RepID=A0ABN9TCU1_9DINO|nr:unnamed protein product [Polarella glacialis]